MHKANKLPVGRTIAQAYRFTIANIGDVVRIAWLPAVLNAVVGFVVIRTSLRLQAMAEGDAENMGLTLFMGAISILTMVFVSAVAGTGIIREVVAPGSVKGAYYFQTGRVELRLFFANLRLFLALFALALLAGILFGLAIVVFALLGIDIRAQDTPAASSATVIAGVVAAIGFVYVMVTAIRMTFFLPAVVVLESNGGLGRAHEVSVGNFFRAFGVLLAIGLPIAILTGGGQVVLLLATEGTAPFELPRQELSLALDEALTRNLIVWQIYTMITFILTNGLLYSASTFAYLSIVPPAEALPGSASTS